MFKDILRWTSLIGIFIIPVILPFIVPSTMFFPYITGKNFTFRIIVEIILASWFLLALLDAKYRPRFSWMLSAFALFVVVIGIADFFGANPFKSFWSNFERMEGYITMLHLFAYFVVTATVLNTNKLWNAFWYTTLATSVVVAFVGLKPIFNVLPNITHLPRIDASFGNPIYLAVYSLFHIFIAFILMEKWKGTHWHQFVLGLVAFLHIATMILTQTRGTVLGFFGGALISTILISIFERERKILRFTAIGLLIFVASIITTGFAIKDTNFAKTTPIVNRFTQISLTTGTVHARFMNWGIAWQGVKERPLLGWGQGNYEYVFSKYYDPNMYNEEPWFDRTHDIIFDWLIAGGFLGLISYFLITLAFLSHLWLFDTRKEKESLKNVVKFETLRNLFKENDYEFTTTERALWTGLIAAYTFHNLFVFDNIISYILFVSVLSYLHFKVTRNRIPFFSNVEVAKETVLSVAFPVSLVFVGILVYYANVPGIKSSQEIIKAIMQNRYLDSGEPIRQTPEEILEHYKKALSYDQLGRQEVREQLAQATSRMVRSKDVTPEIKKEFSDLAVSEIQKEEARNPNSARLRLFGGSVYSTLGKLDEAEKEYRKAVELAPKKQTAIFQLGEILLMQGKLDETVDLFKKAYELQPEYDEAAKLYALVLIRSGKDKEAIDILTKQFGTPVVDDRRLFNEWVMAKRYDIVASILEKRVEDNPSDIQQKVSLAATYKKMGEKQKALDLLQGIKEHNPEYADQMDDFIKEIRGW